MPKTAGGKKKNKVGGGGPLSAGRAGLGCVPLLPNATRAVQLLQVSCLLSYRHTPYWPPVQGKKLDGSMLGFASGTNYALLEQPDS